MIYCVTQRQGCKLGLRASENNLCTRIWNEPQDASTPIGWLDIGPAAVAGLRGAFIYAHCRTADIHTNDHPTDTNTYSAPADRHANAEAISDEDANTLLDRHANAATN